MRSNSVPGISLMAAAQTNNGPMIIAANISFALPRRNVPLMTNGERQAIPTRHCRPMRNGNLR